jgi:pimeloyl-ACP methyl ester carboxylesterase
VPLVVLDTVKISRESDAIHDDRRRRKACAGSIIALAALVCCLPLKSASAERFNARGVNLHYVVQGAGEPIILIHGFHSSIRMNWQMPGVVDSLAKSYKVIALDMPGHGESDKPTDDSAYGLAMVEDVALLLDHLKIKKAHIIGYSMGGMIALKFMATHQDRVTTGVLGGMGWLRDGSALQTFWDRIPARQSGAASATCARSFGKLALSGAELRSIKVPVEVIVGDRDPTKSLYVTPLQQARRDWPVVEIAGAGHLNCIIKPEFKEALVAWLLSH